MKEILKGTIGLKGTDGVLVRITASVKVDAQGKVFCAEFKADTKDAFCVQGMSLVLQAILGEINHKMKESPPKKKKKKRAI